MFQVLESEGQFFPLKLVSGQYAYSMEATCPNGMYQSLLWSFLFCNYSILTFLYVSYSKSVVI